MYGISKDKIDNLIMGVDLEAGDFDKNKKNYRDYKLEIN